MTRPTAEPPPRRRPVSHHLVAALQPARAALAAALLSTGLLSTGLLAGCGVLGELAYSDLYFQQDANCRKLPDTNDMRACLAKLNPPKGQVDAARQPAGAAKTGTADLCYTRAATGERVCPN